MRKSRKIIVLLFVISLAGLAVYYFFNPKKALNIIIPEIDQIKNIHVAFNGDTAYIDLNLKIENKSIFKLNIDSLIYQLTFDSAKVLARHENINVVLKHRETDTITLPLALPFKRLMKKIKSLQSQDSVNISVGVRVVYATIFGRVSLPYSKIIRIEVPHPPKIEVQRMEYVRRDKKTIHLLVHVIINNRCKLGLNVSDLKYQIEVKDLFKANGNEKKEIKIKPRSNISVALPIKVEFKYIFKTVRLVLSNKDQVNYHLSITGKVQTDKVSDKKTPFELENDGEMELKK